MEENYGRTKTRLRRSSALPRCRDAENGFDQPHCALLIGFQLPQLPVLVQVLTHG